ncbi:MAG: acyl--CoA ligase [Gemmataceae bacterium]
MTPSPTLAELLTQGQSSHTAVILPDDEQRISYGNLAEQIEALAARSRQAGWQPGDVIALALPNGLEYIACFLALTRARLVAAPLNPAYKEEEYRFYLEDASAKAVIVPPGPHAARAAGAALGLPIWTATLDGQYQVHLEGGGSRSGTGGNVEPPRPDDVALFLHTSGTTSRPKGVPLTHANLMTSIANIAGHYRLSPEDVSLLVMPLFHVHGLIGVTFSTLFAGGTLIVPPRFSAGAFWPAVRQYHVTWYSAVPTIHQVLVSRADADDAPRQSGLRFIRSCSSALAPATLEQVEQRFAAPVLEAYAMTEAAHQMTSNPLPPAVHKPGSVGRGTNVAVAIMDEAGNLLPPGAVGEVVVRGANVMAGYRNNPEANAASFTHGWFRTGDQGVLDEDGYLQLTGRIKELINRGGEKIAPLEVDAALLCHPAVAEAACFAAADAKYGEEVHAAVVLKGQASVTDLQKHCGQHLADFKIPKVIHLVPELPKGPTGKVQRRHLAAHFQEQS